MSFRRQHLPPLLLLLTLGAGDGAAGGAMPGLRLSFVKVVELLRPLWLTLELGGDLLTERQKHQLVARFQEHMRRCVTAKRRSRSCPRAVRRVVSKWPRLLHPQSVTGPITFRLH